MTAVITRSISLILKIVLIASTRTLNINYVEITNSKFKNIRVTATLEIPATRLFFVKTYMEFFKEYALIEEKLKP
jgi:hypothetical protein